MRSENKSYADRWLENYYKENPDTKPISSRQHGNLKFRKNIGITPPAQAEPVISALYASRDVPLSKPDIHPVVLLAIELRKSLNLSQVGFARCLNISEKTVQDWTSGRRRPSGPALTLLLWAVEQPEYIADMSKSL